MDNRRNARSYGAKKTMQGQNRKIQKKREIKQKMQAAKGKWMADTCSETEEFEKKHDV